MCSIFGLRQPGTSFKALTELHRARCWRRHEKKVGLHRERPGGVDEGGRLGKPDGYS